MQSTTLTGDKQTPHTQDSRLLLGGERRASNSGNYGAVSDKQVWAHDFLEDEGTNRDFPWPQVTLVTAAMVGMLLVVFVFARDYTPWDDFFARGILHVIGNLTAAFGFFFCSDVIAQTIPTAQANQRTGRRFMHGLLLDYWRATHCGCLGIFINGFGYYAWVHALNIVIPRRDVDRDRLHAFGLLVGKSLLDSCLWGTTSNSVGILGRRLLEGDSMRHATDVWASKILNVTVWELRFWPFWSASQFYLVPNKLQVIFTSFGALLWNCYISYTALEDPVDSSKISVNVDGVASPSRRFVPRRSLDKLPILDLLNLDEDIEDVIERAEVGRHYSPHEKRKKLKEFTPVNNTHASSSTTNASLNLNQEITDRNRVEEVECDKGMPMSMYHDAKDSAPRVGFTRVHT